MNSLIKVALAQLSVTRAKPSANLESIESMVMDAKKGNASVVIFPEMATTGFDWRANLENLNDTSDHLDAVTHFAVEHSIDIAGSFLEMTEDGCAANAFHYIDSQGKCILHYQKMHLFTLFDEQLYVQGGKSIAVNRTRLGKTGAAICYDLRFPELFRACIDLGAEVFILPAAFPHPRLAHWQSLLRARAIENQCFMIAVNQTGRELHTNSSEDVRYFGHSMVVDPWGETVIEADESEGVYFAIIDLSKILEARRRIPALKDRIL